MFKQLFLFSAVFLVLLEASTPAAPSRESVVAGLVANGLKKNLAEKIIELREKYNTEIIKANASGNQKLAQATWNKHQELYHKLFAKVTKEQKAIYEKLNKQYHLYF
ncbi:DUF148 domain-containing protein [Caenorhabditis elegans]|uniref:DUF148 domain-containing protein n=1 Tax=Caenorhabditis elegans TaxID=6239 RepID=O45643_CAEEL|nr:DUF148 domain-containing protein [Caenorhabditis elegans]CAB05242.1 DUF148 domain-containing protein [Caenorhabditis elegans]|eukprot:NP_502941.1 Uncharacterized protein CELE_K03D3.5 [Caenorhabditis elegans]